MSLYYLAYQNLSFVLLILAFIFSTDAITGIVVLFYKFDDDNLAQNKNENDLIVNDLELVLSPIRKEEDRKTDPIEQINL